MSAPLVSVVIPNHNYAGYLGAAIDSALAQSYSNVEVIVVDDGSTDGSEAVARRYGQRVRWIAQPRQGVSAARNRGIAASRGELVAFLDADDLWRPEKLARQVEQLRTPAVGVVGCGLAFISPAGDALGESVSGASGRVLEDIALLRWPGAPGFGSTALVRKACFDRVGLFDTELSTAADWDLWRRIACHYEMGMVREPLALYRVHRSSMHRNLETFEHDMLRAFSRTFADPSAAPIHPLRRQCYGHLYLMLAGSYLHAGRWGQCLAYLVRAVRIWPRSLGYVAALPLRRLRAGLYARIGDRGSHIVIRQSGEGGRPDPADRPVNESPSGHSSAVIEQFDQLAASGDWSRLYAVLDGRTYHFHVRRQRVLELLPSRLGRVADLGCGPGVMVDAVLARGGTFEGVDLSPEMIKEARRRFDHHEGVSFAQGTAEALDLPGNAYDQVICMAVIEYLTAPDRALGEIARILRPGGSAVITVPKRWHIDRLTVAVAAPLRALARASGFGTADGLPRLCLQPHELDIAARRAGLVDDGGAQYHFTPLPYPLPRIAPGPCMRLNILAERLHATRAAVTSFLAHGYVGRYRKPGGLSG